MTHVYLTVDQLLTIHYDQIEDTGGLHGVRDKGALESAVARPQIGYYDGLTEEASALLESLAINHAFIDGNKRTAFVATSTFLELNGYYVDCDPTEANQFIRSLTQVRQDRLKTIHSWLKKHIEPTPFQSKK